MGSPPPVAEDGAPRTFEVPPGGADAAGLEDYVVETSPGERIGTVVASVEKAAVAGSSSRRGCRPSSATASFVPTGDVAGPTDRSLTLFAALAFFALGLLALLAIVAVLSRQGRDTPFLIALVIPAGLIAVSALLAYRLWRDPIPARVTASTGLRSTT